MQNRKSARPLFQWAAIGLASAMLYGCGGSGMTERAASVQVSETATTLSVKTELPAGRATTSSEMQSLLYTFAAQVDTGPNAGTTLKGTLVLKGEREDDGTTEVEGRLLPDAVGVVTPAPTPGAGASAPTPAELKAQFEADRKALKIALRADIEALSAGLRIELAAGNEADANEPSAAQQEAMATFKAMFDQRIAEYRAALSSLVAQYRAATVGAASKAHAGDEGEKAAEGYEVHGSIDALGAVRLTLSVGDIGKILAIGNIAADGSAKGSLTGPAGTDQGSWTAMAAAPAPVPTPAAPPPPPPAVGDITLGAMVYQNCTGCHGPDPAGRSQNIQKGVTVAALTAAFQSVGSMNRFQTSLSGADRLNLAAYIKSRVAP